MFNGLARALSKTYFDAHFWRLMPNKEGKLASSDLPIAASEWFRMNYISAHLPLAFSDSIFFPEGAFDKGHSK